MAAVRKFVRIIGSPRNSAAPLVSSSGTSPCFSGDNGSTPLQAPTAVCQCPAKLRLPALGLEPGRFQTAYGAAPPRRTARRHRFARLSALEDPR